ncbi:MAG: CPBP family intramembrane glutamic endopeptidase [Terriglobia bacterium]
MGENPQTPATPGESAPAAPADANRGGLVPSPERSGIEVVFLGPNGIRAGWRLLIYLIMAIVAGFVLSFIPRLLGIRPAKGLSPSVAIYGEGSAFLALLLAAAVMARIERRSFADYALPLRGAFGARFWQGVAWGFVALTALLLLIRADHGFSFGGMALHGRPLAHYALVWGAAFLSVGFLEEFLFRGYTLYTLTTGMGFWPSALLLSALFGAVHLGNTGESWIGGAAAGLIGLFFCFTLRRTGSLWFAVGLHAMWDYSESFIYSVPDSGAMVTGHLLNSSFHGPNWLTGGTVGPEGSWLVFAVIAAMFVVFDRWHREVRFPLPARLE